MGDVEEELNTYAHISFNFGPTLLRWFARYAPDMLLGLRKADEESAERNGGHGNAIGQAYHHVILPLANEQDKRTEVRWGIEDFRHRFGRLPEGMWLAETAVDLASLEVLASEGMRWVILAPGQAARVRATGEKNWKRVSADTIDTRKPYRIKLRNGSDIVVFFYGGEASQGVAFGGWLNDGTRMAEQLKSMGNGIVSMATDGESYGHHHARGDMALAYCIKHLRDVHGASLSNFGAALDAFGELDEAEIHENSAWSCSHGVGRWCDNCGCVMDPKMNGKQQWRKVLRRSLNWLRDEIDEASVVAIGGSASELWESRDAYISELIRVETFPGGGLSVLEDAGTVGRVLEAQRHRMMMFTSCGWFFDDPTGLETVQLLRYAGRAIELCEKMGGPNLRKPFLSRLSRLKSATGKELNGAQIFRHFVEGKSC